MRRLGLVESVVVDEEYTNTFSDSLVVSKDWPIPTQKSNTNLISVHRNLDRDVYHSVFLHPGGVES